MKNTWTIAALLALAGCSDIKRAEPDPRLAHLVGKPMTLEGTAVLGIKDYALLKTTDGDTWHLLLQGPRSHAGWPTEIAGKKVKVTGILKEELPFLNAEGLIVNENGAVISGRVGPVLVECDYEVIE